MKGFILVLLYSFRHVVCPLILIVDMNAIYMFAYKLLRCCVNGCDLILALIGVTSFECSSFDMILVLA